MSGPQGDYVPGPSKPAGALDISLDMDSPDARERWTQAYGDTWPTRGRLTHIGVIPNGMNSGRPSAALLIELDDGRKVFAETSWRNLALAAVALIARWGTP